MRAADEHLTPEELESLRFAATNPELAVADGEAAQWAKQHLDGCAACQQMAKKHVNADGALETLRTWSRRSAQPASSTADCPDDEIWLRIAAGLVDDAVASQHVTHAAQCDRCGRLLQESMEDLAQDVTLEEQAAIAQLPSAGETWQGEMAKKLRAPSHSVREMPEVAPGTSKQPIEPRKSEKLGWWLRLAFAAAGLAVFAVAGWLFRQRVNPDPTQLLAEAYTQQRTVELRMSGAGYGPMRVERGIGQKHRQLPPELLEAEAILARRSAKHSSDVVWLQAQARAALLEWDYDTAIKKLDDALLLKPDDPNLLVDRATALFERAERLGSAASLDYGEAAEDLSLVLKKKADDPVALFNRAIIYEKLSLPNQAISDLEHYLRIDSAGPWAQEARERLERLKKLVEAHQRAMAEALADPRTVSQLANAGKGVEVLDQRIEDYQELAIREWLPEAFGFEESAVDRKQVLAALSTVASILSERHQDKWMQDLLHSPPSEEFSRAILSLKEAVSLSSGDAMGAFAAAGRAAELFERVHNGAGSLRSRLEQVHALQRAQQGVRCLQEGRRLASRLTGKSYPWVRIQLQVDRCGCSSKVGDFEAAMAYIRTATKDARTFAYPTLELRSVGLAAAVEVREGNVPKGWAENQTGLRRYWAGRYIPPLRAQQFYDASVFAAEDLDYIYLSRAIAEENALAATASSYPSIEALVRSHLAKLQIRTGEFDNATKELNLARHLLSSLPLTVATRAYLADTEIDLAEVDVLRDQTKAARERLADLKPSLQGITSFPIQLRFYWTYARALAGAGDSKAAQAAFAQARGIAVSNLQQLTDSSGRYFWVQETSALFRDFVQFELLQGNPEDALSLWEWFRSSGGNRSDSFDSSVRLQKLLPSLQRQTVMSYAVLPRGLAVWVFDDRGVHSRFVELNPAELTARGRHFLGACADPRSSLRDTQRQARSLYEVFVAPMESWITADRLLVIEPDERLGDLPFQALLDRADIYLGDSKRMIYSPGVSFRPEMESASPLTRTSKALVVAASVAYGDGDPEIGSTTDVEREAEAVAVNFPRRSILTGSRASATNLESLLPQAEIFHYSGHAVATTLQEGLVLSGPGQDRTSIWSGGFRPSRLFRHCRLVVLAACSTGTARLGLRETHGRLVHTILSSGVPHVMASQWNVDSAVTTDFMKSFYAALLQNRDIAIANRTASRDIRQQPGKEHPYYWAAFAVFSGGARSTQPGG